MEPVEKTSEELAFETHDKAVRIITGSVLRSFDHPNWRKRLGKENVGGPFLVKRCGFWANDQVREVTSLTDWTAPFTGNLLPWNGSYSPSNWPVTSSLSSLDKLSQLGTTAIKNTVPTSPTMSVSTSIGEIMREGLPSLLGFQFLKKKLDNVAVTAASEYLNLEFAWKPIISDLRSLAMAVKDTNRILDQYIRDSGRRVRREWKFPLEVSETTTGNGTSHRFGDGNCYIFQNGHTIPSGRNWSLRHSRVDYTTTRRIWFKGTYSYFVPPLKTTETLRQYEAYANKLLGTRLTPEVVWNLMPWTWLIDWFTNAGDVISNISSFATDDLVLHHGYIMEHVHHNAALETYGLGRTGSWREYMLRANFYHETKTRIAASPYGFGFTLDDLTIRQMAILAALGVTRSAPQPNFIQ